MPQQIDDPNDNGQDPRLELPPIDKRRQTPPAKAAAAVEGADAGGASAATLIAQAFAKALSGAKEPPKVRYGEDNQAEVWVRANRRVHISPADLAYSRIAGTAYGMDGPSHKFEEGEPICMRPGPGLDSLLDAGRVRLDDKKPAAQR